MNFIRPMALLILFVLCVPLLAGCGQSLDTSSIHTLCLEVNQSYPEIEEEYKLPVFDDIYRIMQSRGIIVVSPGNQCDATLSITFTGKPIGSVYAGGPKRPCYTGADVWGTLKLDVSGQGSLKVDVSKHFPLAGVIYTCHGKTSAPLGYATQSILLEGLIKLFGADILLDVWYKDGFIYIGNRMVGVCKPNFCKIYEMLYDMVCDRKLKAEELAEVTLDGIESDYYNVRLEACRLLNELTRAKFYSTGSAELREEKMDRKIYLLVNERLDLIKNVAADESGENTQISELANQILESIGDYDN